MSRVIHVEILYKPAQIRLAIRRLFATKHAQRRRVACVAFVGADCLDFVPYARGLEVYCWPQPGGTSAIGINRLLAAGAKVRFAERLHSKVYWTDGIGCLVTSANLTHNALGDGGLAETAVFFDSTDAVSIETIIASCPSYAPKRPEIVELGKQNARVYGAHKRRSASKPVDFGEWLSHPAPMPWKLGWVKDDQETPRSVLDAWQEHGVSEDDSDWMHSRKNEFAPGDWLLVFDPWHPSWTPYWMFVSCIVPKQTDEEDSSAYPFSAVQIGPAPRNAPFTLRKPFPQALGRAVKQFGAEKIAKSRDSAVSPTLLKFLATEWQRLG